MMLTWMLEADSTRPAPELSAAQRAEVKKIALLLLDRMRGLLVLNWRQKSERPRRNAWSFLPQRCFQSFGLNCVGCFWF